MGHTISDNTKITLDHFDLGPIIATDAVEPLLVTPLVVDSVQPARNTAGQRKGNLRAKAGRQMEGVLHRVTAATTQIERP